MALLSVVLAAGSARGEKLEIEELASSPVELTAPLEAAELVGGSTAEIAWRPLGHFAALVDAEEWEAFLSVDGGRTFAVRLTPHLDLAVRRFTFSVPDLPSADVRLLLRFGNEREERAVRHPGVFRIVRATAIGTAAPWIEPARTRGEPALPGGRGVLFWAEGRRDGGDLRFRSAVPFEARSSTEPILLAGGRETALTDQGSGPRCGEPDAVAPHPAAGPRRTFSLARVAPLVTSDILLLIQRQNE
jgi:hypothetical protein